MMEIQGEKENECCENDPGLSHNEAFECLEIAMKWLKRQNDADPIQLTCLRIIRDMAALKSLWSKQQSKAFLLKL